MVYGNAQLAVFAPVDSTGRVDAVVRRLTDVIALGLLAHGEQLPSETDLAARLGVSKVTLREALTTLRREGLLETRRGRGGGSFVRAPSADVAPGLSARVRSFGTSELRDFSDHYAAIAGAAAALAAQRALPEDLAPLERSLGDMAGAGSTAEHCRLDGRFHIEIAAASQSARLTQEEISLQAEIGPLLWIAHERAGGALDQHHELVETIRRGDASMARLLAERHVLDAVEHLIELRLLGPGDG